MEQNELKEKFFRENNLIEKEYVDDKTNKILNQKFEKLEYFSEDEFEGYLYERNEDGEYDFYKEKIPNISEKEIEQIIMYQNNGYLKNMNKNIKFITRTLKVFIWLTIIYILVYFFVLLKYYNDLTSIIS